MIVDPRAERILQCCCTEHTTHINNTEIALFYYYQSQPDIVQMLHFVKKGLNYFESF